MAGNVNSWLMLYYPANVDFTQMLTLPVTFTLYSKEYTSQIEKNNLFLI